MFVLSDLVSASVLYDRSKENKKITNNSSQEALNRSKWICQICPKFLKCKGKLPKVPENCDELDFAINHNNLRLLEALIKEDTNQTSEAMCKLRNWLYNKAIKKELTSELETAIVELFI